MQHPEAELLLFENYLHFSSTLSSIGHILENKQRNNCVCIHEIIRLIIMKVKMKMKNRSHRYEIGLGLDMNTNIVNIKRVSVW